MNCDIPLKMTFLIDGIRKRKWHFILPFTFIFSKWNRTEVRLINFFPLPPPDLFLEPSQTLWHITDTVPLYFISPICFTLISPFFTFKQRGKSNEAQITTCPQHTYIRYIMYLLTQADTFGGHRTVQYSPMYIYDLPSSVGFFRKTDVPRMVNPMNITP